MVDKTAVEKLEEDINEVLRESMMSKWRATRGKGFFFESPEAREILKWHEIPWAEIEKILPPSFANETLSAVIQQFKELKWDVVEIKGESLKFRELI